MGTVSKKSERRLQDRRRREAFFCCVVFFGESLRSIASCHRSAPEIAAALNADTEIK